VVVALVVGYFLKTNQQRRNRNAAYDLCVIGRDHMNRRTQPELEEARKYFDRAIRKDPAYALAYAGMADCYALLGSTGYDLPPEQTLPNAVRYALKALEYDSKLAEAHTSLGIADLFYNWDLPNAEKDLKAAVGENPTDQIAQYWYVVYLIAAPGHLSEAIARSKVAEQLDPDSPFLGSAVARAQYYNGLYEEAIDQCQKILRRDPRFFPARFILASSYEQMEKYSSAIDEFKGMGNQEDSSVLLASLGTAFAKAGMQEQAKGVLAELDGRKKRNIYISPYYYATIYANLNNKERAFDFLEQAYKERSSALIFLQVEPTLGCLQGDKRFKDLVDRIKPIL
ncbi:MAG TPA: tetratricopeptide repeat protein, partial [Blastocatellia bacterium]|nr:tetratricopeptide repeat protein [Blastocatellia bacterium]